MRLETKLSLSTGSLAVAMILSSVTAHFRIADANRLSLLVLNGRIPVITLARDIRFAPMYSVRSLESSMLLGSNPKLSARLRKERLDRLAGGDYAKQKLMDVASRFNLTEVDVPMQDFQTKFGQLRALEEEAERLSESGTADGSRQAVELLRDRIIPLDNELLVTLTHFVKQQEEQRDAELLSLTGANRGVLIALWATTIFGALIGTMISVLMARHVARRINQLAERANEIAAGDLTGDPLDFNGGDEIGRLGDAMNGMQMALGSIIGTVAETAGSLTGSAASMRSASDHIHNRIDQQAQKTEQAATAMQEMSASIAEVSRHTQSAAETARSAAQTARDGGEIVKEMLRSMHSIESGVRETSTTVGRLGEDSKRISQIVTVIDEIARKTNLLALNAAIEAARAGDQGRGFAVVADEVRRLAESTAQATGEIGAMIQEIQDRTESAIASMASGAGTVQEGVATTTQAGEALERIIGMAERVDRMIAQIAIAASQQADAADQSSASLDSIHSLSNENLSEIATTAAGIENLRGTAVMLERQVDRFQVERAA